MVILVGPPASGKSSFAAELIRQGKIAAAGVVSSDDIAVLMFGETVNREAMDPQIFAERDRRVAERLAAGLTTVVDATNVVPQARARLVAIARQYDAPVMMLRFAQPPDVLLAQSAERDKRLPTEQVSDYAELMAAHATTEHLRAEDVWAVHDVPGRAQHVTAAQAATDVELHAEWVTTSSREPAT